MVRTALSLLGVVMAAASATAANPQVVFETSQGNITVELFEDKAPLTVKNFLDYVDSKHYDGTVFHRVIDGFMIQGGGFDQAGKQKPTKAPVKNESSNGVKNDRGTIAMARTRDVDSATSQFFINHRDNSGLNFPANGGYTVFGKVVAGMDVVDKIAKVKTKPNEMGEMASPVEPVVLKSVKRVEKK
jgi:cyclophilin family peptidyl-prolyl cis-trans isomerase